MQKFYIAALFHFAKKDKVPMEIVPGLYIGSIASVFFPKQLENLGITHIVSAIKGVKLNHVIF